MAAGDCSGRRRFAVACGVLSRCIKAEAAGETMAVHPEVPVVSTMLLMPGADVVPDVGEEPEAALQVGTTATQGQAQAAQLTIMYGGRVLVLDDFPTDRVDELVRVAAAQGVSGGRQADMPVARKASLQRFMEKRRDRIGARALYAGRPSAVASKKGKVGAEAECLLGLGIPGARRGDTLVCELRWFRCKRLQ